jgi:hypothetical protein
MKLERSCIAISVTEDNREFFRKLNDIRPNYISFSQFLGLAANEYHENHKEGISKITDFTTPDAVVVPNFHAEVDIWKNYIKEMPVKDIKVFQKRLNQLTNLMNRRVQEMLV